MAKFIERRKDSFDMYDDNYFLSEYPYFSFVTMETSEGDTLYLFSHTAEAILFDLGHNPSRTEIEELYSTEFNLIEFDWKEGFTPDDLKKATAYSMQHSPNLSLLSDIEDSEWNVLSSAIYIAIEGVAELNLPEIAKEVEETENIDLYEVYTHTLMILGLSEGNMPNIVYQAGHLTFYF